MFLVEQAQQQVIHFGLATSQALAILACITEEHDMKYIVSPKYKKSVRYETVYRHTSRVNTIAILEQYLRFESFLVEFQPGVNIEEVKDWDQLDLDDSETVTVYETRENFTDVSVADWRFSGLSEEESQELEMYIEENGGIYDHEDWEELELTISILGGVNIEPHKKSRPT